MGERVDIGMMGGGGGGLFGGEVVEMDGMRGGLNVEGGWRRGYVVGEDMGE